MAENKRGRPPKPAEKIPDTFENILKAVLQPVKKALKGSNDGT